MRIKRSEAICQQDQQSTHILPVSDSNTAQNKEIRSNEMCHRDKTCGKPECWHNHST